jgi:hypothetical protein
MLNPLRVVVDKDVAVAFSPIYEVVARLLLLTITLISAFEMYPAVFMQGPGCAVDLDPDPGKKQPRC